MDTVTDSLDFHHLQLSTLSSSLGSITTLLLSITALLLVLLQLSELGSLTAFHPIFQPSQPWVPELCCRYIGCDWTAEDPLRYTL